MTALYRGQDPDTTDPSTAGAARQSAAGRLLELFETTK